MHKVEIHLTFAPKWELTSNYRPIHILDYLSEPHKDFITM